MQIALIRAFMLRLMLLLTSVSRPYFERVFSARQPDIISKSLYCANYHAANIWSNCARSANVGRVREVCERKESVQITVSIYWVKAYQSITNKSVGSGISDRNMRKRGTDSRIKR